MRKIEAKLIAKAFAANYIDTIDLFAFDECNDLITEGEKYKIIEAIKTERDLLLSFVEKRIEGLSLNTTRNIIESILYEV